MLYALTKLEICLVVLALLYGLCAFLELGYGAWFLGK
jgi:hypothetical protein